MRYFVPIDSTLVFRAPGHEYGWLMRDPKQHSLAVYIRGPFSFQDPASTAQLLRDGGLLMWHEGSPPWAIDSRLFMRTYELAGEAADRTIHDPAKQVVSV